MAAVDEVSVLEVAKVSAGATLAATVLVPVVVFVVAAVIACSDGNSFGCFS